MILWWQNKVDCFEDIAGVDSNVVEGASDDDGGDINDDVVTIVKLMMILMETETMTLMVMVGVLIL